MQFLKILFLCLIVFIAAVFTLGNWTWVTIRLWGGLVAETNLPFLLLLAFLAGLIPTLGYQHLARWRLRQRLQSAERQLATLRALTPVSGRVMSPEPAHDGPSSPPPPLVDSDAQTPPGQLF